MISPHVLGYFPAQDWVDMAFKTELMSLYVFVTDGSLYRNKIFIEQFFDGPVLEGLVIFCLFPDLALIAASRSACPGPLPLF
jgi:hypothetical protein